MNNEFRHIYRRSRGQTGFAESSLCSRCGARLLHHHPRSLNPRGYTAAACTGSEDTCCCVYAFVYCHRYAVISPAAQRRGRELCRPLPHVTGE